MTIRGVQGKVMWSYRMAADLHDWTVTTEGTGRVLAARLGTTDSFAVSQRPLMFVATHAKGAWRWPIESLQISGASLTAVLGPRGV